ncbi:MAG: hydroxyisourate hydrolase [Chitinophagaceae bacterium]
MSQVTTHVLDTSKGRPAEGIAVSMYRHLQDGWDIIAQGKTNADGRVADLLLKDVLLPAGIYKMRFETAVYFSASQTKTFYPAVEIIFEINSPEHYHVPLLLNPFGYSTYRGS